MFRALLGSAKKVRLVVTKSFQQVFRATDLLARGASDDSLFFEEKT
jgi:hypothetical protein